MTNEARTLFEKLGLHTCQKYFKTRWLQGGITARIYVQGKEEPLTTIIGSDWKAFGSEANKNKINKAISNEYDIENVSVRLSLGFRSKGNDSDAWYTFVLNHVLPEVKAVVPENSLFKTIQGVEIVFEVVEGVPSEQLGALRKLNSDAKKKVGVLFKQDPRFSFSLKFIYHKKIEISENNREGWVKGAEEIKNTEISFKKLYRTDAIIVAYFIFVHLSKDNDTTNLRYFLPLLHYLNNTENRICKLYLHVDVQDEKEIAERVNQLFATLPAIKKDIFCNGSTLRDKMDFGDLFPLICFSNNENPNSTNTYNKLLEGYLKYVTDKSKYKGTEENKLSTSQKQNLSNELSELLPKNFEYNKLAGLCILYLLKNHIDNKVIIRENEIGQWELDKIVVKNTLENSKTFAEGLFQLIENAQKHSKGHVAYFGMRIYKADPNESAGKIAEEAQKREALWRKYWAKQIWDDRKREEVSVNMTVRKDSSRPLNNSDRDNIFNLPDPKTGRRVYSDFIEFYVLDVAIDENGASGIVDVIQSNDTLKPETEIESIEKIFELVKDDYNDPLHFYIEHYGMRWLKSHVDRLNGIMEIYSPYSQNGSDGKACCYSNVFENLEKATPYYKNLYSTEYSILIPLEHKRK